MVEIERVRLLPDTYLPEFVEPDTASKTSYSPWRRQLRQASSSVFLDQFVAQFVKLFYVDQVGAHP